MSRPRVAMPRHVRGLFRCAVPVAALLSGAPDAQAHDPRGAILLDPPPSLQTSLSLDGRDWRMLAGASVPLLQIGRVFEDPPLIPRLRAGVEILTLLGLNALNYWSADTGRLTNSELSWSEESWKSKVVTMKGVSFDGNEFWTNAAMHPFAGTLYYRASRSNGLGVAESFLFASAGSAIWEYVVEFPEKVSLNDLVITPAGGMAIGEPLHQLGVFFARGAHTPANLTLSTLLQPFGALHRWMDGRPAAGAGELDRLGLPADVWHRFRLFGGILVVGREGETRAAAPLLGVNAELINLPGYGRPGRAAGSVPAGSMVNLAVEAALDGGDLVAFDLMSRTALGGYSWQALGVRAGGLTGYSLFAGVATAYSYTYAASPDFVDKIGAAHLGPAADLSLHYRGFRLRGRLDAYADFAAVRSAAIDAYLARQGPDGIKSVVAEKGYYFAAGLSLRPALTVSYGALELGGEGAYDLFESIEGCDRRQHEVTRDIHLQDQRLGGRAWLAFTLPGDWLRVSLLDVERREREGTMDALRASRTETRLRIGADLVF